ncbi:adenosylcobinamide-GDP ribazoletransferase [Halomicrococcus gelatinilyticus]|uniref:adenosylcobinamide-GDP ribazoletransferase n=1 Tax=Halomicrococcus gelatinilyticus TaxID=1702103 RepID=UPI002E152A5A
MVLTALRGALGFLSRLPLGRTEDAWEAFRASPTAFPLAGYVVGALVALPLLVPAPVPTVALLFVAGVYAATGINHVDGVTDLGDAAAVHGGPSERRDVMTDTVVGTGGALAVALVVLGLGTAGAALAGLPARAALVVVTAEVGAKLGMATLVCLGSAPHEGLGSALTANADARSLVPAAVVALPAVALTWPRLAPGAAALTAAVLASLAVFAWARTNLGGVSGDVLGATNEVARVAALHAGVVAWTRF